MQHLDAALLELYWPKLQESIKNHRVSFDPLNDKTSKFLRKHNLKSEDAIDCIKKLKK